MTDHKAEGRGKDLGGKIKETVGQATGNEKMERDGQADQAEGKVQHAYGEAKDEVTGKK